MKKIKIVSKTHGTFFASVDDIDYEKLIELKWHIDKKRKTFYAATDRADRTVKRHTDYMHRIILNTPLGMQVDHKDGNGLNNQRANIRNVTHAQNQRNKGKCRNNTSGYKGVSWSKSNKKWQAQIKFNAKYIHIGHFSTKLAAYEAYCAKCVELHGNFAKF
jgi:hypothetical protein